MPIHQLKPLCKRHGLILRSPNFRYYFETCQSIIERVKAYSDCIEIYSIDESFFEIKGLAPKARETFAQSLRRDIWHDIHIPVSVGVAETKTLAKIATVLAKRNPKLNGTLNLVGSPHRALALERTPLRDVWGVGGRLTKRLQAEGLVTARDLAAWDPARVRDQYGVVLARTVSELQGISCLPVTPNALTPPAKSVMFSRSFGKLVRNETTMRHAVATYTRKVAEKLRVDNLATRELTVFIQTNKHRPEPQYRNSWTLKLPAASQVTAELTQYAFRALTEIYRPDFAYYKAGVVATDLVMTNSLQISLFDPMRNRLQCNGLMAVMDHLNDKLGPRTVYLGAEGLKRHNWMMKREHAAKDAPEELDFFTARQNQMPLRFF